MAGTKLSFGNGYMGVERCQENTGKQFLMAHIYSNSKGLRTSAPVATSDALEFAADIIKQALLAEDWTQTEINNVIYAIKLAKRAITRNDHKR